MWFGMSLLLFALLLFISQCLSLHSPWRSHTSIVEVLQTEANINLTLKERIIKSIENSNHNSSSADPWTLENLYYQFDAYLTYLPAVNDPWYSVRIDSVLQSHDPWDDPWPAHWLTLFVNVRAQWLRSPESASIVQQYLNSPLINMNDYITPPGGFTSFSSFFTRSLQPGARPISEPNNPYLITSPCDGNISGTFTNVGPGTTIPIKGLSVEVGVLLGGNPLLKHFEGGMGIAFGLNNTNYHHFHTPISGYVIEANIIGRLLYGHSFSPLSGLDAFWYHYHRGTVFFHSPTVGFVAMVPIGLIEVGSVVLHCSPGDEYKKGDLLGNFDLGGSSIFLLFEPGRTIEFVKAGNIQVGQPIATITNVDYPTLDRTEL